MSKSGKAKTSKRGQPRRRVVPFWRHRYLRVALIMLLAVLAGGGGWRLWQSDWIPGAIDKARWSLIAASTNLGFKVNEILVVGRSETTQKELLAAVRLARGAPILAFDLQAVKKRIEALAWVKSASVERMLPDTVLLNVIERQPLALWQHKGRFALIDHEGTVIHGWIDLWAYDYPLSSEDAAELAARVGSIPALLDQARTNLTGNARDLWLAGLRSFRGQSADLGAFRDSVAGTDPALDDAIFRAKEATDAFLAWLEEQAPSKTGPSGVGKANYTWYMRNVHLVPYSWEEQVVLMRRELARAHSSLRLEENRNRHLPELERISSAEEYDRELNAAVTEYMQFLEREQIHTIEEYMDPALRAVNGQFTPAAPDEVRNFFSEVTYRDPLAMRTHMHHWIELARKRENPHPSPIRRVASLYNIWDARSEGLATGVEEMMMHAGLFDARPRTRELIWIMLAQRAARALSGLYLHGNEFEMEEAVAYATEWTPRGWLPDGDLVRNEQHLYLRQPGYGTSYLTGKIQIEELLAERGLQLGDDFTIGRFFDEFFEAGVIPITLTRWEMTGRRNPILDPPQVGEIPGAR